MASSTNQAPIAPAKVLASAATGVMALIETNHGDVDTIFGHADIRTEDIESPFSEFKFKQYCLLFEEAARQTGNDNFGLHFGNQFLPKQLGAIGYAATSSPTLSAALRNMETYFPAHQDQTSFGILHDSDVLWLYYRIHDARIEHRQQDAELSLGMFCNVFRHVLGPDWSPLEVCFEHGNGSKTGEHERMFGAPVRFGRRTNAIAFKRADLDAPMPEQDPYLFSIVESFLRSRCQLHEDPTDFAAVVHEQIKLHMRETAPVIADIAAILGISDRAFQRRLKRHRLTYHDLLRAVRRELALKYMRDPDIPLTDIAMMVGYPELSAFSRAFRAWTGMSPQRYRRTSMRV